MSIHQKNRREEKKKNKQSRVLRNDVDYQWVYRLYPYAHMVDCLDTNTARVKLIDKNDTQSKIANIMARRKFGILQCIIILAALLLCIIMNRINS